MKIQLLKLFFLLFPVVITNGQISENDVTAIEEIVKKAFTTFHPAGLAIAVVSDDQLIYHQGFGYADASKKTPVKTTSLFNIASCSKAFTAASVAMLVDEGKLKWTDKVVDYLPEFRLADDYITREMTIEDLLCHRSGLGTFFGDLLWYNTDYTDEEVMRRVRFEPITRRFGIQYGYQNIMFLVAGEIIEKVSGQSWSEFVTSRIFKPLGMAKTRPSNDDLTDPVNIALGHINNKPIGIYDFNAAKAAAGLYSNVDELSAWTMLILNRGVHNGKRLISEASVERLMEPHTVIGASPTQKQHGINFYTYGMGWYISDYNGEKIVEHDGGMPGYISKVLLIPSKNISVIILNNGNDFFVNSAIKGDLLDILAKGRDFDWIAEINGTRVRFEASEKRSAEQRAATRVPGTQPSHKPEEYAGLYRDKSYGDARVSLENGKLRLTFLPAREVFTGDLEHWHYDTFKVVFRDEYLTYGLVTFSFDEVGKATGFKIDLPSADFHFWNLDFKKP